MLHCRLGPRTTVLVILLAVVLLYQWYIQLSVSPIPMPQLIPYTPRPIKGKVHVLLLSSWRSGSSFLGQVFSQHPSVFYLMEPGWHVWTTLHKSGARVLRMAVRDLIRSVFHCDLSTMEAYMPELHDVSTLFRWSTSRALCSPPVCSLTPRHQFSNETECRKRCGSSVRGLQAAVWACHKYSHVVLKEVRFFELESLYPLLQDPALDLRIIHMVRDPRAVVWPREQSANAFMEENAIILEQGGTFVVDTQYRVMQEICRSHVRIHERATFEPPEFLKGRYMMVRYEDIVQDPLTEIKTMYEFVGLEMTGPLQDWIYTVTHGKGKDNKKQPFEMTSQEWRSTLAHDKVKQIQEVCKDAMSLLGYRMLTMTEPTTQQTNNN